VRGAVVGLLSEVEQALMVIEVVDGRMETYG